MCYSGNYKAPKVDSGEEEKEKEKKAACWSRSD